MLAAVGAFGKWASTSLLATISYFKSTLLVPGIAIWFLSTFKEWLQERAKRRHVLRRLHQETKGNKEILLSIVRPQYAFPCTHFVLSSILSRGMTDIPESDELYNAVTNGHRLYGALETFWEECIRQTTGKSPDSPEARWANRVFALLVSDYCVPLLDLGIRLINLELKRLPWGKSEGRRIIRLEQMSIERRWKETAEREGLPVDLEQYELTLRRLSEGVTPRAAAWR